MSAAKRQRKTREREREKKGILDAPEMAREDRENPSE